MIVQQFIGNLKFDCHLVVYFNKIPLCGGNVAHIIKRAGYYEVEKISIKDGCLIIWCK